jgi:allantoin racemase
MSDYDSGLRILTPIAILSGWEPGNPTEEPYEVNENNFEEIDASVTNPDTEVVYKRVEDGIGPYVKQHHETDLVAVSHARESFIADTQGEFDAIRLPCFDEPGVEAARELSDTLVMSTPSASLHVASMLGDNIGIVISGTSTGDTRVLRGIARKYGFEDRVASIRPTGYSPTEMHAGLLDEAEQRRMNERALEAGKQAIEEDDADVLIGYSGAHEHLESNLDVPVVKPESAAIKMTEALAKLGLSHSKRAYPTPEHVHEYYLSDSPPERRGEE